MFQRSRLLVSAALLSLVVAPTTRAQDPQVGTRATPAEVLADMDWLAGTWSGDMWGGRFVAYYSTPEGGKIIGHSKLLKDGEEAFFEFEVFEGREQVVWVQPYPGGRRAVGMQLATHDPKARKAVFENPDKDYPTRIVYHRKSENELVITLSDPHGESDKVEVFALAR